ncbi:WW domain [Phytophthora cactorum]|nr:WW domain [Phytophthora cactorum]
MKSDSSSTAIPDVQLRESDATALADLIDAATAAEGASDESLWVRKWDDTTNQLYYFNLRTQESSWEEPKAYKAVLMSEPMDMDTERAEEAVQDSQQDDPAQSDATVTIQSLYRGRKDRNRVKEARKWTEQFDPATGKKCIPGQEGRDRVKQLADEEEEEEQLEQQLREEHEAVAAVEEKLAALAAEPSTRAQWCEYFDPRLGSITTATLSRIRSRMRSQRTRKRIAANEVAAKREKLRALTNPVTMQLKLGELKQVSVEIQAEIEARTLVSTDEEQQFPHLSSLITGWKESFESIQSHVTSLENRAEDILLAECLAARIVHAERFHKALAEMRSECLALLRSILLMNSYFVDLDVARINAACTTFANWKSHELTDFNNGSTSATGKRYEDWHPSVVAALAGVHEMEEGLAQKMQLLRGYRTAEVRKREISQMAEEDLMASRLVQMQRRRKNEEKDHAALLVKCQEFWQKGLNQREEDSQAAALESMNKTQRRKEPGSPYGDPTSDSDQRQQF